MTNNEYLERSTELRERADTLVGQLLADTHVRRVIPVLFSRHACRTLLCEIRQIVADFDGLVEKTQLAAHAEGYQEGESETRAQIEADRHEPIADWETAP